MRRLASGLFALYCFAAVAPVYATRRCGDDVGGRAVPCDCGDVLVGSRTLGDEDPIVGRICPATGLVVSLPAGQSATLALGGHNLIGAGRGFGIQVLGGGSGVSIVGPGAVQGFAVGILAAAGGLSRLADVTVAQNVTDGVNVVGDGYAVSGCDALRNGRDGFVLRGRAYHADNNRALENGRAGFAASGRDGTIGGTAGNEASGNGRDGFRLRGRGHEVAGPVATANARHGVVARVTGGHLTGAVAASNPAGNVRTLGSRPDGCQGSSCR